MCTYEYLFLWLKTNNHTNKKCMTNKKTKQDKQMLAKYNNNHATPEQIYYQHQFKLPNI